MINFKIGDVVRLNSGGPPMTVWAILSKPMCPVYEVCWFSGSVLHRDAFSELEIFPEESLEEVRKIFEKVA